MKYNCDNIADFAHELGRVCHANPACQQCPLEDIGCEITDMDVETLAKTIMMLQEWSDNHPENEI